MTVNPQDELLSAFYDGEATEQQRAVCSKRLEESPQSQRELDEFKKLSQMLRSLPPESLPEDFRSQVLQAAERRMLLPEAEPVAEARAKSHPHLLRRWRLSAAALVSSAAILLLTVNLLDNQSAVELAGTDPTTIGELARGRVGESLASSSQPGEERTELAMSESDELGAVPGVRLSRTVQPSTQPADQPRVVMERRETRPPARNGATPAEEPARPLARLGDDRRSTEGAGEPDSAPNPRREVDEDDFPLSDRLAATPKLYFRNELRKADVGAVVEALDTSGEQVNVVKLTVIDRRVGLKNLQLVLSGSKIPLDPSQPTGETESKDGETADPELIAVFVEATDEQLHSALLQLNVGEQFRDLSVEPPIRMASLDDYSGNRLARRDYRYRTLLASPRGQSGAAEDSVREDIADTPAERAESNKPSSSQPSRRSIAVDTTARDKGTSSNERFSTDRNKEREMVAPLVEQKRGDDWYKQNTRQMQINVPQTLLYSNFGKQPPADMESRLQTSGRGLDKNVAPVKAPPVRRLDAPVQVLFVLVESPAANPVQPSPAGRETPN